MTNPPVIDERAFRKACDKVLAGRIGQSWLEDIALQFILAYAPAGEQPVQRVADYKNTHPAYDAQPEQAGELLEAVLQVLDDMGCVADYDKETDAPIWETDEDKKRTGCCIAARQQLEAAYIDYTATLTTAAGASNAAPIPMRLTCEGCGKLHIDEGEFSTKPHHTHSCQHCGLTWRPAIVPTRGVAFLPGFKNEQQQPVSAEVVEKVAGEALWNEGFTLGNWESITIKRDTFMRIIKHACNATDRRFRDLVQCLIDNDPNELAADGGITVLDVWRKCANAAMQANITAKE